jgi:PadR family transcriptional regulator PadR
VNGAITQVRPRPRITVISTSPLLGALRCIPGDGWPDWYSGEGAQFELISRVSRLGPLTMGAAAIYMSYGIERYEVKTLTRDVLGNFEFQLLAVLFERPRDAYGISIMERIKERTGRAPSLGAIYTGLDRLEKKGFVKSWWGEPTMERGGRRKRYYRIEDSGAEAVRRTSMAMRLPYGRLVMGEA